MFVLIKLFPSESIPEKGRLEPWFNVFMLSVGFHKPKNASFNLTNHRLVMNADVRCKNAGVRRVFNWNVSAAVIGRTGLRRKMRGYPLVGASQINYPPSEGGRLLFPGYFGSYDSMLSKVRENKRLFDFLRVYNIKCYPYRIEHFKKFENWIKNRNINIRLFLQEQFGWPDRKFFMGVYFNW